MAQSIPDYSYLPPDIQAACQRWNATITIANRRLPALSNPPPYLQLCTTGFDTFEELKTELDAATKCAGFVTTIRDRKKEYARLVCARGAKRHDAPPAQAQASAKTIKVGCPWTLLASATKASNGKWVIRAAEKRHEHHGPQDAPGTQRGYTRMTPEINAFLTGVMEADPGVKPRVLRKSLELQYPNFAVGQNTIKNWLQSYRKEKRGGGEEGGEEEGGEDQPAPEADETTLPGFDLDEGANGDEGQGEVQTFDTDGLSPLLDSISGSTVK